MAHKHYNNSQMPASTKLTNGYTLYDWVMRMSCYPSFWGRDITGARKITREEVDFLKGKNCKIAFLVRDLKEEDIAQNDASESSVRVISAAKALGIPQNQGIALFAEFASDYSVNHNWMIGYAVNLINNGYIPGFIGNTDSSLNFNFDRQCSHYIQATKDKDEYHALYWSTEPKYSFEPQMWGPYAPSQQLPKDMHLWRYGGIDFHSIHASKSYIKDSSVLTHFL